MNSDAHFSKILSPSKFEHELNTSNNKLTNVKNFSVSEIKSSAFCSVCERLVEVKTDIFWNHLSPYDFSTINDFKECWYNAITVF